MKRSIYIFLTVLILSGLSACTSYNYYTAAINKTNLSNYRTFAWMPNGDDGNNKMNSGQVDAKIRDAATMALEQKGLRVSQNHPDLVVTYMTKVGIGTKTDYYYGGFYPGWGWGPGWGFGFGWGGGWRGRWGWGYPYYGYGVYSAEYADKEHYKEGTLIIDLVDSRTHKIVWRGFGVGEVHHNPQKTIDDLPKVVDGVLAQLQISPGPVRRY